MSFADQRLTLRLRSKGFYRIVAYFYSLMALGALGLGVLSLLRGPFLTTVQCDRQGDTCTISRHLLSSCDDKIDTLKIEDIESASIEALGTRGSQRLILKAKDQRPLELGGATTQHAMLEDYRSFTSSFRAFLGDASQATFSSSFNNDEFFGGFAVFMVAFFSALALFFLWRLRDFTLDFDKPNRRLTITQRRFFLVKKEQTILLDEIKGAAAMVIPRGTRIFGFLRLEGEAQKSLFLFGRAQFRRKDLSLQEEAAKINAFLGVAQG